MFDDVCWLSGLNMADRNGCLLLSCASSINRILVITTRKGLQDMITICDECESVHTIDDKKQYLVHASAKISQVPNHNHSIMLHPILFNQFRAKGPNTDLKELRKNVKKRPKLWNRQVASMKSFGGDDALPDQGHQKGSKLKWKDHLGVVSRNRPEFGGFGSGYPSIC